MVEKLASASQLTAGRTLCLTASLLLRLPAWAPGWTASSRVQLTQRGGRSLLFGSPVPSWRWNQIDLLFPIKCRHLER